VVARIWHGAVPLAKADLYLSLMRIIALHEYRSVTGNCGAYVLQREADGLAHFTTLTFWESREAIKRFAGDDIEIAKYYDFDRFFLVELEPHVRHYDVFENATIPNTGN
jgi:heme-degrading monooxygenase HmoA